MKKNKKKLAREVQRAPCQQKLMGRWIAALPSRPVHNTVQVYQSTRTTRVIRLHSLK